MTDGPFTETKELVAGFALIQAKSKEEAIEYTKNFLDHQATAKPKFARSTIRRISRREAACQQSVRTRQWARNPS